MEFSWGKFVCMYKLYIEFYIVSIVMMMLTIHDEHHIPPFSLVEPEITNKYMVWCEVYMYLGGPGRPLVHPAAWEFILVCYLYVLISQVKKRRKRFIFSCAIYDNRLLTRVPALPAGPFIVNVLANL
jgi:hypothetical protein